MTSPCESHSRQYSHINGSISDMFDRMAVSELCKGWCAYRDNSEWMNYRSLFTNDAIVWTTWSGPRHVDDFIEISKAGKEDGVFIQHRECGTAVELNPTTNRAVGKMKATITQRFTSEGSSGGGGGGGGGGGSYDVDCDCRFIFFCVKQIDSSSPGSDGEWKAKFVKLIYEKDKLVPVDGMSESMPVFGQELLKGLPEGYRFLGGAQRQLGYNVDCELATLEAEGFQKMYKCMEDWLDGGDGKGLFWGEGEDQIKD